MFPLCFWLAVACSICCVTDKHNQADMQTTWQWHTVFYGKSYQNAVCNRKGIMHMDTQSNTYYSYNQFERTRCKAVCPMHLKTSYKNINYLPYWVLLAKNKTFLWPLIHLSFIHLLGISNSSSMYFRYLTLTCDYFVSTNGSST